MDQPSIPLLDVEHPRAVLKRVFGFDDFRPGQQEIVEAALAGESLLAVMPTGGGKSLCFQLPALMKPGLTVVVSPLIALMRDQVAQLRDYGVAAAMLNSANPEGANAEAVAQARAGALKLLYVSPERLMRREMIGFLGQIGGPAMIAVDEAHCVSQWGHDFRPEYQQIGAAREALGEPQLLAFTATADAVTREDIGQRLFAAPPRVFLRGFDRPNIRLSMTPRANPKRQLLSFLSAHTGESGVIYCQSRRRVEETTAFLCENGWPARAYHAGMSPEARAAAQDSFLREDGAIVVATVAFGMGVDKPDVRFVFHMDLPKNIESYYQEIGRAGRDGLPATAETLYGLAEIRQYRLWIDQGDAPEQQKRVERRKLSALLALCEAPECRRAALLGYFGEPAPACGNCDLCLSGVETFDGLIEAQKALSAIVRTREMFGMEHLINVLRGESTDGVLKHRHAALPTFGVGADRSRNDWRSIYRQLYAAGLAAIDMQEHGAWRVTDAGWEALRGKREVRLRRDVMGRETRRKAAKAAPQAAPADVDQALLKRLKALRLRLAQEKNVPAYVVFSDKSLLDIAARKPDTPEAFLACHGVGDKKLEAYGEIFLKAVAEAE